MDKKQTVAITGIVAAGIALAAAIVGVAPGKGGSGRSGDSQAGHADDKPGAHAEGKAGHSHAGADAGHGAEKGDAHGTADTVAKGPHGGQLFTEGDFGIEVVLAEDATAKGAAAGAQLRAYLFEAGKPIAPSAATVTVTVTRPTGQKQDIAMRPQGDALVGTAPIAPPHVFEATVAAQKAGEPYLFTFSKEEGKVKLTDEQLAAAGITLDTAAPARLSNAVSLPGEIQFNQDRTAHVVPRVAGVVEAAPAALGAQVGKGQLLAVIASTAVSDQRSELAAAQRRLEFARTTFEREQQLWQEKITAEQDYLQARTALQEAEIAVANARQKLAAIGVAPSAAAGNRFELRAPFAGTVLEKHVTLGEAVSESTNIFTISDLSTVWANFNVPASDLAAVRVGQKATVRAPALNAEVSGTVSYVGSLIGEQTRTATARVTLPNPQGAWRPGLFVNVILAAAEGRASITVPNSALQTANGRTQVFVRVPGGFIAQPVELGASDGQRTEIVNGLTPGAEVATTGSFVIKSEAEKSTSDGHAH